MSRRLEKQSKTKQPLKGHEVETWLFIYHTLKLFPDVSAIEMRRFIAKHLGILVSYSWTREKMYDIKNSQDFLREVGKEMAEEEVVRLDQSASESVALITDDARKAVANIIEDSQQKAKGIKGKMMDEIDIRLEADTESFTNDELIRGSKAMHDIETNTQENPNVNINFVDLVGGIEKFNQTLDELKRKESVTVENPGTTEVDSGDGEVQTG